ncbi:hypothetical protein C5F49_03235 [Nitrosopumilus oxyclinae]|uniref:Uncharacterized protein n=1 Tax=Nitrosopumilus oxyclinae TaxID=1959104 RepID=A0A7D5R2R8_9ARCH|nr:hypothetical protein [Nitrosopumilus oxyclinae]QLH04438.1 hypothetical protein C5F49_03235 [Nitrosopumilus oxyclinae]
MNTVPIFAVILGVILISGTLPSQSFADVINPRQQMKLDFTNEQIICAEGLVKITKSSSGKVACVKPTTAEKLAEHGWAKQLSEKKVAEIKEKKLKKGESVGNITKIVTLKQLAGGNTPAKPSTSGYSYVFEACSTTKLIRAPEIFVTSDSETKNVKLATPLKANSCYTSSVNIKAADPNSISATLLNKGGISEKISSLESQITDLKTKIATAKAKLPKSNDQSPESENMTSIITMKKELKDLQDQLRRYFMVLYVPPSTKVSKIDLPKSITGQPLEGMSTNLISVTPSVVAPSGTNNPDVKRFNVVFEACAGMQSIRLPIITVTSDTETIDVKLIDRIIPESCQVGIARINALDSESIIPTISGNSGISKQIKSLETQISEMEVILADKRSNLGDLISKKLDSTTEPIALKLTQEISELRNDILENRVKLNSLLLKAS